MNLVDRISVVVSATTGGAVSEFQKLEKSAKSSQTAADRMGAAFGVSGKALAAGVAAGAAAIVGSGLLHFLDESVEAYGKSAKAAGDLAAATGSSAETVSRMSAALEDAGVSAATTNSLLTKFTVNFQKNAKFIADIGVAVQTNKDGTADYAATMVAAVDAIEGMGDAAQRNAAFVRLFGKAGASAFQDLSASGVKLSEAMRLVDKYRVFTADDVRRAAAYDDAVDSLHASFQGLQFTVGRNLVPALTDTVNLLAGLVQVATPLLDVLTAIPPEIYLVAAAAVFLGRVISTELIAGAFTRLGAALVITGAGLTSFRTLMLGVTAGIEAMNAALIANPVTAALVLITAAFAANQLAVANTDKSVRAYVDSLSLLERQALDTAEGLSKAAKAMEEQANFFENLSAAQSGSNWAWLYNSFSLLKTFWDALVAGGGDVKEYEKKLRELRDEAGQFAAVTADAQAQQKNLNDTVAEFLKAGPDIDGVVTSWQDVADAATEANEAILRQKQVTNAAETALGQYAVSVEQVIAWQKKLAGQPATIEEALNRIQTSFETLESDAEGNQFWQRITDDAKTFGDEAKKSIGDTTQAIYDYAAALAAAGMSTPDIVVNLTKLKDRLPKDLDAVVDQAIAQVEGKPTEMALTVVPTINFSDPAIMDVTKKYDLRDPTQFKKWLDEVTAVNAGQQELTTAVTVTAAADPTSVASTNAVIQNLTADRTVDIYFQTHGYNEIKRIIDTLTRDRTVNIGLASTGTAGTHSETNTTTYRFDQVNVTAPDPAGFWDEIETVAARRRMAGAR